jgi:hypothetical protein
VAQAKRSPILGYNHNVKYRGVVFHVQTEDSGLLNPHLFTHLFHGGVIVSTRKLVYDAGSNEDAIKALMQAQHKAVMKDLMKGAFDEKIDQYLSNAEGLTPRSSSGAPAKTRASTEVSPPPEMASPLEIVDEALSEPIELPLKARTQSDDRTVPIAILQHSPSPPAVEDGAAVSEPAPVMARTSTAQKVSRSSVGARPAVPVEISEDTSARNRLSRDTVDDRLDGVVRADSESMSRSSKSAQRKLPDDTEAVEIYQSTPPSVEVPPGERVERPGQYSVSRKSGDVPIREQTGRTAALNPQAGDKASAARSGRGGEPRTADSGPTRVPQSVQREFTPSGRAQTPPTPSRTGTLGAGHGHNRTHVTAPIANRAGSAATPPPGSGVVMTRPAVIVGAPAKPAQPRVRKAREDEGRGFGQGLISEKSLDEVILAYLSEDADDK